MSQRLVRLCTLAAVTASLAGCRPNATAPPGPPSSEPAATESKVDRPAVPATRVQNLQGPLAGAVVRAPGGEVVAVSDEHGGFHAPDDSSQVLTVFKPGHKIEHIAASELPTTIIMEQLPQHDSASYQWVDPTPAAPDACGHCHQDYFQQWSGSAHARAAVNRRFLNLYDGGDAQGNQDVGWSLLRDHPGGAGVCQSCHAPSISTENLTEDIRTAQGVERMGVHCDFCHKVNGVCEQSQLGWAHGQYALRLLRPEQGQLVFGPRTDALGADNAHSPIHQQSDFCAACHEGTLFGVPVYSTWSEWRESPAAQRQENCQSCHMKPDLQMTNTAPGHGGPPRDPQDIASHQLMPGGLEAMLRSCLQVNVQAEGLVGGWDVTVAVEASHVGHAVPTGFIDRHLILSLQGHDLTGAAVAAQEGPQLDHLVGPSLNGASGLLFAKVLTGIDGARPSPFWRPSVDLQDTRLRPQVQQRATWRFPERTATVVVRLNYRRFWYDVARVKQWDDNEIAVFEATHALDRRTPAD